MVIQINLNFLPGNLKSVIIQDINREYRNQNNLKPHTDVVYDFDEKDISPGIDNKQDIITLDGEKRNSHEVVLMIKDILIKRRIHDYIVIQDEEEEDKIVILKREHGERLGIYHCRYCGMAFEDEIQLSTHLRMHYLI